MSELRPNIGYSAAAVIIKTIQSLQGFTRSKPERRSMPIRELSIESAELTGDAEICDIAPQTSRRTPVLRRHPSPHGIQSDRLPGDHARGTKQPPNLMKCHFRATGLHCGTL